MELDVKGRTVGTGTGGTVFDNSKPAVVFISGASLDHTVWAVPMRYFAQQGYGVLGPSRLELESRPLRVDPIPFLCAIELNLQDFEASQILTVAGRPRDKWARSGSQL